MEMVFLGVCFLSNRCPQQMISSLNGFLIQRIPHPTISSSNGFPIKRILHQTVSSLNGFLIKRASRKIDVVIINDGCCAWTLNECARYYLLFHRLIYKCSCLVSQTCDLICKYSF